MSFAAPFIENGEHLLRGQLITNLKTAHLILNTGTKAMVVIDLHSPTIPINSYPTHTKVEVCVNVQETKDYYENKPATLIKIRPLDPNEATLLYTTPLKGCKKENGCEKFGQYIPAPLLGEAVLSSDLPDSYFHCR